MKKSSNYSQMSCLVVFSFHLLTPVLAVSTQQWTYQKIMQSGKMCPGRDSCRSSQESSQDVGELNWKIRNCFCDSNCSLYGDCCIDAEVFDPQEQKDNFPSFSCLTLKQYGPVYMRTKCSPDWAGGGQIRTACEEEGSSRSDPVGSLPITSSITGITYSNYYCAVCNKDSVGGQLWQPRLECLSMQVYNRLSNNTRHFIMDNIKYNEEKDQWGVEQESLGNSVFHACNIDPYLPPHLAHHLRPCHVQDLTSTCPDDYQDEAVLQLCQSYTGLVYLSDQQTFRNSHCALCNKVDMDKLRCIRLEGRSGKSFINTFQTFSFAVLFDINSSGDGEVGVEVRCSGGEIWDPFFNKCRDVVCGGEGQFFHGGECYQDGQDDEHITTNRSTSRIESKFTSSSSISDMGIITTLRSTTSLANTTTITSSTSSQKEITIAKTSPTVVLTTTTPLLVLDESDDSTKTTLIEVIINRTTENPPNPTINSTKSHLKTCPKFLLSSEEFELQNVSVYVPAYKTTFLPGDFLLEGGNVYICQLDHTFSGVAKFSPLMGYFTMACLILSIISLTTHLVISCIAPQLQNLSGKNLFSLSLALVGANSLFLCNKLAGDVSSSPCFVLAVFMFYFYLASFFWMLNIAFDVALSLKQATVDLRVAAGPQWGKFFLYSLVGWLIPALLVTCAVVIDLNDFQGISEMYKSGFGGSNIGLCWFSRRSALLIYFVIPLFVIMVLNIFFFLSSAFLVYNSTKSSANITVSGPKINFFLYLRLSTLMGLSWISGLVAGWLDIEQIWYVFLVLSTLQGLFILIFFSCTKKTIASVRMRVSFGFKNVSSKGRTKDNEDLVLSERYPNCSTLKSNSSMPRAFAADDVEF